MTRSSISFTSGRVAMSASPRRATTVAAPSVDTDMKSPGARRAEGATVVSVIRQPPCRKAQLMRYQGSGATLPEGAGANDRVNTVRVLHPCQAQPYAGYAQTAT